MKTLFQTLAILASKCGQLIQQKFNALTKPANNSALVGAAFDLTKSKPELLVFNRQIKNESSHREIASC